MHDLYGVVSVLLTLELHKAITLMLVADLIAGDVHVDYWTALRKQLPNNVLCHLLIKVSHVDRGLLVTLVD